VQHHPDEVAEGHEQQDVEGDLQERRVAQEGGRPVVGDPDQAERAEQPQLRALAAVGVRRRHRQQGVGPQRQGVDGRGQQDREVLRPEPPVEAVLHRRDRDEQRHGQHRPQRDRDQRVGGLVVHGPTLGHAPAAGGQR
jgi:hypothetical protein